MLSPGLYVVATPIGNLQDLSYRAVHVLTNASVIAAEDTRHSRVLLEHYGIRTPMLSLHEHNESEKVAGLVERIRNGEAIALVSDAGTPLISDPGFRLVSALSHAGLPVLSVPGPSAVTAALSVSGLASDRFLFEGFLPAKKAARVKRLKLLREQTSTLIFFESSHRILDSLGDLQAVLGAERQGVICRELTKQFETVLKGNLQALVRQLEQEKNQRRGEFVVLVEGAQEPESAVDGLQLALALLEDMPASQAARVAAKVSGGSRRDIYAAIGSAKDTPTQEQQDEQWPLLR